MQSHTIPTRFHIPQGYRQRFIFRDREFEQIIDVSDSKLIVSSRGYAMKRTFHLVLDWMQWVI